MLSSEQREKAKRLGAEGERRVAEYLRGLGYIIVKRNYRDRFGEIDIIAESETEIVFVEVKTRRYGAWFSGIEAVDAAKQDRIYKTGMIFLNRLHIDLEPRFDIAEVNVSGKEGNEKWELKYIKNAF